MLKKCLLSKNLIFMSRAMTSMNKNIPTVVNFAVNGKSCLEFII